MAPTHLKLLFNLSDPDKITAERVELDSKGTEIGRESLPESPITIDALFNRKPVQLGVIYYTHNSPGCVFYIGNKKYEC